MFTTLYPSVCRPYLNGELTLRMRVMKYLSENGAATKRELIENVWGFVPEDRGIALRGWASTTFGYLRRIGAIHYNQHTRKWYIGAGGIGALEVYNLVG